MPPILTEQFAYHGSSGYYFNNNKWGQDAGSGGQSLHVDRTASHGSADGVAWHIDWSWEGGEHNVKSYPYSGRELPNKKLVSEIGSIPTSAEWSYRGSNLRANVAYDLFTAAESDRDTSGGDYELMIWLGNLGDVHPIGSNKGGVRLAGRTWALFIGMNGDMKVYSFVAPESVKSFSADVKHFFNYITNHHGFPAGEQYLTTLQFGTEPFTGSDATFTVSRWVGDVSDDVTEEDEESDAGYCGCVVA